MTMKRGFVYFLFGSLFNGLTLWCQVILDGTMGRDGALPGPDYNITQDLGTIEGSNLFHSFSQFNIENGESATFSGAESVSNIFSRVTGGAPSTIDGRLRSTIPDANLFFVNPAGVMFGPNAQLDIQGSFATSTADFIKLGDEGRFDAAHPETSVLTSAQPQAFGFLSNNPGVISLQDTTFNLKEEKSLAIVGGDIALVNSEITSSAEGKINLVSVKSDAQVTLNPSTFELSFNLESVDKLGNIDLINGTAVNLLDGSGMFLKGRQLNVRESTIKSVNTGPSSKGFIDGVVTEDLAIIAGLIDIQTLGTGPGAELTLSAGNIIIDAQNVLPTIPLGISSSTAGPGTGGNVRIEGENLEIKKSAAINSSTFATGSGGAVSVEVDGDINIAGTTHVSAISSQTFGPANSGNVRVDSETLTLQGRASVRTNTFGPGKGGDVDISVDQLLLSGAGAVDVVPFFEQTTTLIVFETTVRLADTASVGTNSAGPGSAGNMRIDAESIVEVLDSSLIASNAFSTGSGGNVIINSPSLFVSQGDSEFASGIFAGTLIEDNGGDAGNIQIFADNIELTKGGLISADTLGSGGGGNISIETGRLFIGSLGTQFLTQIGAVTSSQRSTAGRGGNINITAQELRLEDGGISVVTLGAGKGGEINIISDRLALVGQTLFSTITATAFASGNGGNVHVESEEIELVNNGLIVAAAFGPADAGNVDVIATNILIDGLGTEFTIGGGFIITGLGAEAFGDAEVGGQAGEIHVEADSLRIQGEGTISAVATGQGTGGDVMINTRLLEISSGGIINSISQGIGEAGKIQIDAQGSILLHDNGIISTSAVLKNGGNISIRSGNEILVSNSEITSQANKNGGNIQITAPKKIQIKNSDITAEAGNNGGNIFIDPDFVILNRSDLIARAVTGDGGDIRIATDVFLQSSDSVIDASSEFGVSGNIEILAPDIDIAGSLATLPEFLTISEIHLQPACAVRLPETFSSLTVKGKDHRPLTPGGLLPGN